MLHLVGIISLLSMMHGTTNIKFIDAEQAKLAYQYKNTKRKLYKTNAAIWYNKICRQKRLKPKYICCILLELFHYYVLTSFYSIYFSRPTSATWWCLFPFIADCAHENLNTHLLV